MSLTKETLAQNQLTKPL
jgi:hypothetical protein